ncbi:hypothetical protein ERJ75_001144400 [Trypanosoma vivax]|nr:hypothetical protein ERJ75_001144400 [Trypanosoma vivax]
MPRSHGGMTVSNGLDTYLKSKCAQMFTADSNTAVMPQWSDISEDEEVAKADGHAGSVTAHSNLGEESNGNTQDTCILFARAASSNAGIAVAASRAYTFGQFIKVTFVNTNGKIEIAKHTGQTPGGMSLTQIAQNTKRHRTPLAKASARNATSAWRPTRYGEGWCTTSRKRRPSRGTHSTKARMKRQGRAQTTHSRTATDKTGIHGANDYRCKGPHRHASTDDTRRKHRAAQGKQHWTPQKRRGSTGHGAGAQGNG